MRRRNFIAGLAGTTFAWPLAARAQQTTKLPTIGFMGAAAPSAYAQWVNAFMERLRAHDWIEGRTVSSLGGRKLRARRGDRRRIRPNEG